MRASRKSLLYIAGVLAVLTAIILVWALVYDMAIPW